MSVAESKAEVFIVTEVGDEGEKKKCTYERYVQPCLAELLGTSIFIFMACAAVLGNTGTGAIQPALAEGFTVAVLITMFGPISGGHFNPVVSLGWYLCGGMELTLLLPYVLAQLVGAMIGAALTKLMYPSELYTKSLGGAFVAGEIGTATLVETIFTMILITVVCLGAINKVTQTSWGPICVGFIVTANILAGAAMSGPCMNPARAFGPAVAADHWDNHWVYWIGPTSGTLLSVAFIRFFLGDQKTRVMLK